MTRKIQRNRLFPVLPEHADRMTKTQKIVNYGEGYDNPCRKVAFRFEGKRHLAKVDRYRPLYGLIIEVLLTRADGSELTIKAVVKHDQETPRRQQGDLEKQWQYGIRINPLEDVDGVKCLYGETLDLRADGHTEIIETYRMPVERHHPCLLFVERKRVVRILGEGRDLKNELGRVENNRADFGGHR